MKSTLLIILLAIVLSACNSSGDGSVSVNNTGDETEHIIHLNKIKDSLHINLSDIARDFEFLHLKPVQNALHPGHETKSWNSAI